MPARNVAVFARSNGVVTTQRGVALVQCHEPGRLGFQRYEILCDRYFEDLVVVAARLYLGVNGYPHPSIHRWTREAVDWACPPSPDGGRHAWPSGATACQTA